MLYCAWGGVSPLEFWELTYREIHAVVSAHHKRMRHDQRIAIITGYHAGIVGRSKKPPKLEDLLKPLEEKRRPKRPMTPRQIRNAIFEANRALGGKVRYRPKAASAEG